MYEKIDTYLNKCIEKDVLSHSYIFYGPDEINKKNIAIKFARKILNSFDKLRVNTEQGRSINTDALFHPDLILIQSDGGEERSISLIRQLQKFLILSPYSGNYKIVIIEAFEKLNPFSQNTLLKIFEEAPSHAIIILCAKTIDSIPNTIVSRGVKLSFWKQYNIRGLTDKNIISFFNRILSETSNKNLYYESQSLNDYKTIEVFRLWLRFLRDRFLLDPSKKLADLLKVSQNIYFKLNETNINPKFAYDELILNM